MQAQEFYSAFELGFAEKADLHNLVRSRGKPLKWRFSCPDGTALTIGFRLNLKNLPGYPGEFMPTIEWSGARHNARDNGEVSLYQYTSAPEIDEFQTMQKAVVENFVRVRHLEGQAQNSGSLVGLLVERSNRRIVPNIDHWLPYWQPEDAIQWGKQFGAIFNNWLPKFVAYPETLEAWCWRVLWASERKA